MITPDSTLLLVAFEVSVSTFDDDPNTDAAELLAHANVAADVLNEHLREAKAKLASVGVNVNWSER